MESAYHNASWLIRIAFSLSMCFPICHGKRLGETLKLPRLSSLGSFNRSRPASLKLQPRLGLGSEDLVHIPDIACMKLSHLWQMTFFPWLEIGGWSSDVGAGRYGRLFLTIAGLLVYVLCLCQRRRVDRVIGLNAYGRPTRKILPRKINTYTSSVNYFTMCKKQVYTRTELSWSS